MLIGVYRLYLSAAWPEATEDSTLDAPALLRQLDGVPNFFYRRLESLSEHKSDAADLMVAVRVAMTQAHVLVLPAIARRELLQSLETELSLARQGFRRRIPILAVGQPLDMPSATHCDTSAWADRMVTGGGPEIAFAIQDLIEEATAERRADLRDTSVSDSTGTGGRPVPDQWPAARPVSRPPLRPADTERSLPLDQIAASFFAYKAHRQHGN